MIPTSLIDAAALCAVLAAVLAVPFLLLRRVWLNMTWHGWRSRYRRAAIKHQRAEAPTRQAQMEAWNAMIAKPGNELMFGWLRPMARPYRTLPPAPRRRPITVAETIYDATFGNIEWLDKNGY